MNPVFRETNYTVDIRCIKPMSSPHMEEQGKLFGIKGKQFNFADASVESIPRNQLTFQLEVQLRVTDDSFIEQDIPNAIADHLICNNTIEESDLFPNGFPADRGVGNISIHSYSTGKPEYLMGHNRPYFQYIYLEISMIVGNDGLNYTANRETINKVYNLLTNAASWGKGIPYQLP